MSLDKNKCIEWCKNNDLLLKNRYRSMFIAVSLEKGVVLCGNNEKVFLKDFCEKIDKNKRKFIFITHTSAFIKDDFVPKKKAKKSIKNKNNTKIIVQGKIK